ncbi:MAG: M23 family metallopeptidase [Gemmatimonadetes bacterium]|nr:M23 family metallopeptidase [Gemmatimonadota bacterium]MCA9763602.1 M23 family metallopeptidase [Gemmatimonadota bacterium]MCA9768748.1 M23 family metallopeptidase [Gemmatimonadota bacterium]HPF62608.1 M23 family metallopeptidase [Gemmatimonadales bacterium]HRX18399.1 M23 family metallopeptidase [Gemmatimonadales bacterium]
MRRSFPKFLLALGVLGAATVFMVEGRWPWQRLSDVPTTLPIVVSDPYRVVSDTLHSGETVSALLARQGVTGLDFVLLARSLRLDPRSLRAELPFSFHRDAVTDQPTRIEFRPDGDQRLRFIRTSSGWEGESVPIRWLTDTIRVAGSIDNSLYESVDRVVSEATLDAGARQALVHELANVNAWSVDFSRDPQPGDPFSVVVERMRNAEGEVRFGRVLASDLTINGRQLQAFRYVNADGKPGYYDAEGKALKREFLAAPVEFRYITSGVGRRFHPIFKTMRAHNGIDYSATTGTPVHAASNGTVTRAGWAGGCGNMVELKHRNNIVTRYCHLSRISGGIRAGARVMQGEVIGRVGTTGNSTAPHLHYEFRVNGTPRDPRAMKFDAGEPLAPAERPAFQAERSTLLQLLDGGTEPTPLLVD